MGIVPGHGRDGNTVEKDLNPWPSTIAADALITELLDWTKEETENS